MKLLLFILAFYTFPASAKDTCRTVKSGRWSAGATWFAKKVPAPGSYIIVNHQLTADANADISGLIALPGSSVQMPSGKNILIQSTGNIVIDKGARLVITQSSAAVKNTIRFVGINEECFVGGGMDVINSDVGLWVKGTLQISGAKKTAWTYLTTEAKQGDSIIRVRNATGWRVGDQVSIAPSANRFTPGFYKQFDLRTITRINKLAITLSQPLEFSHPSVKNPFKDSVYQAEVLNLTRNITIEGTPEGRSHINILMAGKQSLSNVEIKHMGPRRGPPGKSNDVLGRYGLHAHHCMEGSRGTIFDGVVVRNCGSHAFVPHASHGITFKNCISYDTMEDAYWWDFPPDNGTAATNNSNDIVIDSCISALLKSDPINKGYRLAGFLLGSGINNTVKNCIGIGNHGTNGAAAFLWPESSNYTPNKWTFENNIAHSNRTDAIFTWQNDTSSHLIKGFTAYHNGLYGIEHGAYHNGYKYSDIDLFGNEYGIFLHATAIPNSQVDGFGYNSSFTRIRSQDPLFITVHTLPGEPTLFFDCRFPKVFINELPARVANPPGGLYDFVNCRLLPTDFEVIGIEEKSRLRIQDANAFEVTRKGIQIIDNFFKP